MLKKPNKKDHTQNCDLLFNFYSKSLIFSAVFVVLIRNYRMKISCGIVLLNFSILVLLILKMEILSCIFISSYQHNSNTEVDGRLLRFMSI